MKQVFMKRLLIAGIALLTIPAFTLAQKEKDKEEKESKDKKNVQTIVITRSGDKDEKVVVEVEGDKVKVNGKDVKDLKDVNVNVSTSTWGGKGAYVFNGQGFDHMWNDHDGAFSLFSEDANRAMLGVTTEGDDRGAEVLSVTKESAAEKAGLKKGDIITMIDSKKIESSDDVTEAIRAQKPGTKVSITYLRDGKQNKATAELGKWKGLEINRITGRIENLDIPWKQNFEPVKPLTFDFNGTYGYAFGRPRLGLSVQDTDDGVGVKVLEVDEESNAAKAGLQKDDVILSIDETEVKGTDDVIKATKASKEKTSYKFRISRAGKTQTLDVKVPRRLKTADL